MIRAVSERYLAAYRGLPREVWMLAAVLFVNRSGTMVLPFLTLYLTRQLTLSDATAGQMISVYGLGSVAGSYLGGRLSEHLGAFRVQTVCMFLAVPLFLLIPHCRTLTQTAIALAMLAVIHEAVRPANATAIARVTTHDNRTRAFGLQRLAANLGFSFGPAIGGYVAEFSFHLLFVLDALTTLLAAVLLLSFFRMRKQESPNGSTTIAQVGVTPIKDRRFVMFLLLYLATLIVFMQLLVTYPLYLRDHFGFDKPKIGLMFAVNTSIIVLFEMLLVDYTRHWPLLRLVGWGSFLCCAGFGMLPFGDSGLWCVLAMIVATVGEMLSFPGAAAYVSRLSPPGYEGRYMGWYSMMLSLAWVIAPLLGATVYNINREALWIAGLVVGVAVLGGFRLLENSKPLAQH